MKKNEIGGWDHSLVDLVIGQLCTTYVYLDE